MATRVPAVQGPSAEESEGSKAVASQQSTFHERGCKGPTAPGSGDRRATLRTGDWLCHFALEVHTRPKDHGFRRGFRCLGAGIDSRVDLVARAFLAVCENGPADERLAFTVS